MSTLFDGLEKQLNSTLPEAMKDIVARKETIEIEIRFRSRDPNVDAGVDNEEAFRRALFYFLDYTRKEENKDSWSRVPATGGPVADVVRYYGGDVRSIQLKGSNSIQYETKRSVISLHSPIWPVKFSVSGEKKNVNFTGEETITSMGNDSERERTRWSFEYAPGPKFIKWLQVDFTWTTYKSNGVSKREFEIEIEVSQNVKFGLFTQSDPEGEEFIYSDLHTTMDQIFKVLSRYIYNTPVLYSTPMRKTVVKAINTAFNPRNNNDVYIPSEYMNKPKTLNWSDFDRNVDFSLFPPEGSDKPTYAVTIKTDGTRVFVYYHSSGIYLFNPSTNTVIRLTTESPQELEGSMLDAELLVPEKQTAQMLESNTYTVWVFDCLFVNPYGINEDPEVQDYRDKPLLNRLQAMRYVCVKHKEFCAKRPDDPIKLVLNPKTFLPFHDRESFYDANKKAFAQNVQARTVLFNSDGLVYTDMGPYLRKNVVPKCSCKKKNKNCTQCRSFNASVNKKFKPVDLLTVDFVMKPSDEDELQVHSYTLSGSVPFKGSEDIRVLPTQFRKEFYEGTELKTVEVDKIYEFQWSKYEGMWIPLRRRTDRAEPNELEVALANWQVIHNDIPKGVLTGTLKGRKSLTLMRRYHNFVKSVTLSHNADKIKVKLARSGEKRRPRLFDIGSSYGGDVRKWRDTGFEVYALEPDPERLEQLEFRAKEAGILNRVQTIQAKIQDYDKLKKQVPAIIKPVDMVTSFHSMTLVFDSVNSIQAFVKSVKSVLKVGGRFACMAMDGAAIHHYLGKYKQLTMDGIKIQRAKNNPRQILVKMVTSDASLAKGQLEYLVDFDYLIATMEAEGFELILDDHLTTASLLSDTELWWSQMTRLIEMRYVEPKVLPKTEEKLKMLSNLLSGTMKSAEVETDQIIEVKARHLSSLQPRDGQKFWLVGVMAGGSSFFHALLWCIDKKYRAAKGDINLRFDRVFRLRNELAASMKETDIPAEILKEKGTYDFKSIQETMAEYTVGCGGFMVPYVERALNVNIHIVSYVEGDLVPVRSMETTYNAERINVIFHCNGDGRFEPLGRSLAGQENLASFVFNSGDPAIIGLLNFQRKV
jgi:precorrin-6B methylase 2